MCVLSVAVPYMPLAAMPVQACSVHATLDAVKSCLLLQILYFLGKSQSGRSMASELHAVPPSPAAQAVGAPAFALPAARAAHGHTWQPNHSQQHHLVHSKQLRSQAIWQCSAGRLCTQLLIQQLLLRGTAMAGAGAGARADMGGINMRTTSVLRFCMSPWQQRQVVPPGQRTSLTVTTLQLLCGTAMHSSAYPLSATSSLSIEPDWSTLPSTCAHTGKCSPPLLMLRTPRQSTLKPLFGCTAAVRLLAAHQLGRTRHTHSQLAIMRQVDAGIQSHLQDGGAVWHR